MRPPLPGSSPLDDLSAQDAPPGQRRLCPATRCSGDVRHAHRTVATPVRIVTPSQILNSVFVRMLSQPAAGIESLPQQGATTHGAAESPI
jgi:hypothetical protein